MRSALNFFFKQLIVMLLGLALVFTATAFALKQELPIPKHRFTYVACRALFEYYLRRDSAELEKQSRTGESNVYYFTSYYLNGLLSAVEATQSERLLRRAMTYLDAMVSRARVIRSNQVTYRAWGPFVISPHSDVARPNVHYTLQAMVPVARAAAIIRKTPAFREKYDAVAGRYAAFADDVVIRYWYIDQYHRSVPWLDETISIWNDNATNMGLVATFLYQATHDPTALEVAMSVGSAFQAKLAPQGRGWIWESQTIPIGSDTDNTPGSVGNQAGVPDTSHTNREPMLMIFQHEAGILYEREDIERMAHTFTDNLWNGSRDNPSFANYLNGSDKPYRVYKEPGLNGAIYHGWALVGGYDREALDVLLDTIRAIVRGRKNAALERNTTGYGGKMGLTGHVLRGLALNG